jgi:RNA polymerase sigma-70 factor, ECF subfamily
MILQVEPTSIRHHLTDSPTSRCETSRHARQREVQHVSRVRPTDIPTCESLIEQYSGRMLSVARRMLRCEEDAADAVQEAFLAAFVSLHRFRGQAPIYTWLHRIVVNQCLMKLRSQKRRAMFSLDALGASSDADACHFEAVATCDHAEAGLDQFEIRRAVRRCIQRLPEEYREIIILRDIK